MKMKLGSRLKRTGVRQEPVRSFNEMAKELGMTSNQLKGHFSSSSIPLPKVVFQTNSYNHASGTSRLVKLYSRRSFLRWWRDHMVSLNDDLIPEEGNDGNKES